MLLYPNHVYSKRGHMMYSVKCKVISAHIACINLMVRKSFT